MNLQDKILKYFDGKVVRKDLTKGIKGNAVVPTYVLEYLLGQHCATFDEDIIAQGLEKVKNIIKDHFVHRDEAEIVKSTIKEKGQHKIIDKVQVHLNESKDIYEATFSNLGLKKIPIGSSVIKKHQKLLSSGVWCIVDISYLFEEGEMPWRLINIKPIQVSNIDLEEFLTLRKEFTKDEWVDLLVQSLGLEPSQFTFREKLIQLTRMIPHCENNYNFIELGPKGTGKSHIFSELSPHGILISGGDVTQAKLFVNNSNNQIGLVGYWDVVGFDEFAGSQKKMDKKLVDIMKNYMANKSFSRGKDVYGATASFAFVGNTEHAVAYMLKNSNLFDALPKAYYDSAFLDRIHMYLPGWEVAKLRNEMFTSDYGFIVDYIAEILKVLRKDDYGQKLKDLIELDSSLTTRDRDGITKSFSGLMKIIYPHGDYTNEEAIELLNFAMEGRKRVKDQLIKMDETFEEVIFGYEDSRTGENITIETVENIEFGSPSQSKDAAAEHKDSDKSSLISDTPIDVLIAGGESDAIEYKSTLRINLHTGERDTKIEHSIVKTVAGFLNTDGGHLFIGVDDSGNIIGIHSDKFENHDKMNRHLVTLVKNKLGPQNMTYLTIRFKELEDNYIMAIECKPANKEVFLKDSNNERFYIRTGASTLELTGHQMQDYIKTRFH